MSGWQIIETAPKNGMHILAASAWHGHVGIVAFDGREWEAIDFQGGRTGTGFYPTHWQPLPTLPDAEGVL